MPEDDVVDVLFSTGTLVSLYIGRWTGNKKLRPSDVFLEGKVDDNAIYLGHKKMMTRGSLQPFSRQENGARNFLSRNSIRFPIGHSFFVNNKTLPSVLEGLIERKRAWLESLASFIENYEEEKTKQLDVLGDQSRKLAKESLYHTEDVDNWVDKQREKNLSLYPKSSDLERRFPFSWRLFKVTNASAIGSMSEDEAEALADAQRQLQREAQQWLREASAALHKSLGEAAQNAVLLLDRQGKLNPKNLRPLFDAFEVFKAVDFTDSSEFHTVIDSIREQYLSQNLSEVAEEIANSKDDFTLLLNRVATLAENNIAEQAGMASLSSSASFGRFLDLD